jgi:hypothetical protein
MDLVFTQSPALVSRLIRRATGQEVSHVALRGCFEGLPVYLHADIGGVQIVTEKAFYAQRTLRYAFACQTPISVGLATSCIGERYDYVGLLWGLLRLILLWLGHSWHRPLQSPHVVVCSEFIARLGITSFAALNPEDTTPGDLLRICQASNEFTALPLGVT